MLLFDMDGTLIDSNGVWKNVDREFLARRGIAYTHAYYEGVAHTILPLAAKFTKEYCRLHGVLRGDHCRVDWRWPGTPMPMSR